jgi:hypothetical protein
MVCITFILTNFNKVKGRYIFVKDDLSASSGLRIVSGFYKTAPLNQYI